MSIIVFFWTSILVNTFYRRSFCLKLAFNVYIMGSSFVTILNWYPKMFSALGVNSAKKKT
jgi:hypothetical protein